MKYLLTMVVIFISISCSTSIHTQLVNIQEAKNDNYGYSVNHPIKIGYSDQLESITYTKIFLSCLRDSSFNHLNFISRHSLEDPNYNPSFFDKLPKRFGSISGGMLDCYTLTKNSDKDTIQLYFDIYDDDTLFIPKGLFFVKEKS